MDEGTGSKTTDALEEEKIEKFKKQKAELEKDVKKEGKSPIELVVQKELEINAKVLRAKKEAEKIIADGRKKAQDISDKAGGTAEKKAKTFRKKEVEKTNAEASDIKSSVAQEINKVKEAGKKNMSKAVDYIAKAVLPES